MTIRTRKPTGQAPWPITLIAGVEKSGKTYSCAEATASGVIDRTLWISIGEDDPDEYGALPGANFEIVEHDGTYRSIIAAIEAAVSEPGTNLLVIDSMTKLWDLLSNMAQTEANARAAKKGRGGSDEATIDIDLWNAAKKRHQRVVNAIKVNAGPVLLTARMDMVTIMDDNGKPTKHKDFKIKAEKNLVYDVSAIIEMPERGKAFITGVRSLKFKGGPGAKIPLPNFTVAELWDRLAVSESGPRHFDRNDGIPSDADDEWTDRIADCLNAADARRLWAEAKHDGAPQHVLDAIGARGAELAEVDSAPKPQSLVDAIGAQS